MDLIVDLIDQLIELRIKDARRDQWKDYSNEIYVLKERLRLVMLENVT